jgi:threonine dehydrogenase-like Zn-dependent dehydrogenase
MRSGAGISCVVNGAAGREAMFARAEPPHGERIAVIGAGPAGLAYASLVAKDNSVTIFEKDTEPGGAFRYAGLAPLFQEVEAKPESLQRYVGDMVAACRQKRVTFRFATDITRESKLLAPFNRIVVATGASYPLGLGPLLMDLLERGAGHWPVISRFASMPAVRDWFYYRARSATGEQFRALAQPGQTVVIIGDAAKPGKSKEAIASAFEAALLGG